MTTSLTKAQERAIREPGNVLVVAGAGTGKTRTLVHRCVRFLLEEQCGLDEILMVTFTDAAAAEMRKRIREELRTLQQRETAANRAEFIRKQLLLLDAAHIGTLHSFCLKVVRRHTHQLGIDPMVTVLDEQQAAPLQAEVLDGLFEHHYQGQSDASENVRSLIRQLGNGSDDPVRSLVLRVYYYCQSLADPERWLAGQERFYSDSEPTAWRKGFEAAFEEWRQEWLPALQAFTHVPAIRLCTAALGDNGKSYTQAVQTVCRLLEIENDNRNWPSGSKDKTLDPFRKDVKYLGSLFQERAGMDILSEEWDAARPQVLTLLRLVRDFEQRYSAAKREMGGVEFSDLEQMALRLLRTSEGKLAVLAEQWRKRFRFIFVDECQDINRAQDAIIRAVSREGENANRFLVGDVKQSIYRFRRADPSIFTEYEKSWREGDGGGRIPLSDNFRSRENILLFVNAFFSSLMRPAVGGICYEADAHLQFAKREERKHLACVNKASSRRRVELHLIDNQDTADEVEEENPDAPNAEPIELTTVEREARLAAVLLRRLQSEKHQVWDEQRMRPVEWSDMAILLRSVKGRVEAYAKEFSNAGIPLIAPRTGFFQAAEVRDLISLLQILDNPLQDVPVLAVLRAPIGAFSLEELATIRVQTAKGRYWLALQKFHGKGKTASDSNADPSSRDLWQKAERFLTRYGRWRNIARQGSVSDCLQTILAETHYEAFLLAEDRGAERVANVHRLLELARRYDPYQRQGLYRFLRFIEVQEEQEVEHEPASAQTHNAVRLMTIHKSKGLEFPVVLLGGLGTMFNLPELGSDVLIQDRYGICPKIWPVGAVQNYSGLAHWMGKRAEKRELLGEEMRLLYVALTRARDTLLLTGTPRVRARWPSEPGRTITDREVISASSHFGWLAKWLASMTSASDWSSEREGRNALIEWRLYSADEPLLRIAPAVERARDAALEIDDVTGLELQKRITWQYPRLGATREPAVKRVSEVIWSTSDKSDEQQLILSYDTPAGEPQFPALRRRSGALTAAEIGTFHHLYLQTLPLKPALGRADLESHAERMVAGGTLTRKQVEALDLDSIYLFWKSDPGVRFLSHADSVQREVPFTARFSPEDLQSVGVGINAAELPEEYFVTRGAIDLAAFLRNEIWILDFKTDQLRAAELAEKTAVYGRQLKLYALAIGRIYRRPVTNLWLHFLSLGQTVAI